MPVDARLALVVALLVGLVMAALTLQCLAVLVQAPMPHEGWRVGLSAVVVTGVWWLLNGPVEGPVLLVLSQDHGLTLGDLFAVPGLLLGAALLALAIPVPG